LRITLAALCLIAATAFPAWAGTFDDPVALVEHAYDQYAPGAPGHFEIRDHASPDLLSLFEADDARTPDGEMGALGFDPIVNGQDYDLSDVSVTEAIRDDDKALVAASFSNMGTLQMLMFTLVPADEGWQIDEIESVQPGFEWRLTELLAAGAGI
jgi:hypothetical protein